MSYLISGVNILSVVTEQCFRDFTFALKYILAEKIGFVW
jgi:hypothetical protein